MCLLDILRRQPGLSLIVAHVNHGIRQDAAEDEKLVVTYAMSHNITCEIKRLNLEKFSEEIGRKARYEFLRQIRKKYNARQIVTAHHEDDLIETAIVNLVRGTGWRGIAPFGLPSDICRPLQNVPKQELIAYAKKYSVPWREDTTNMDLRFTRNKIRHTILPKLDTNKALREEFLRFIRKQQQLRRTIQGEANTWITKHVKVHGATITGRRYDFIMLPSNIAYELLQQIIKHHFGNTLLRKLAEDTLLFIKTAKPGKTMIIGSLLRVRMTSKTFIVESLASW